MSDKNLYPSMFLVFLVMLFFLFMQRKEDAPGNHWKIVLDKGRYNQVSPQFVDGGSTYLPEVSATCYHLNYHDLSLENTADIAQTLGCVVVYVNTEEGAEKSVSLAETGTAIVIRFDHRMTSEWANNTSSSPTPAAMSFPGLWGVTHMEKIMKYGVGVQIFNEVDLRDEWSNPDESWFGDVNGVYAVRDDKMYDLGKAACAVAGTIVRQASIRSGREFYFVIPGLSSATSTPNRVEEYVRGCADGLITQNNGLYNSIVASGGTFIYGAHIYSPFCTPQTAATFFTQELKKIRDAVARGISYSQNPGLVVRIAVTEAGLGYGFGCTRIQQSDAFSYYNGPVPLAWWVAVGTQCHPANSPTFENNPDNWNKMAIYNVHGDTCK